MQVCLVSRVTPKNDEQVPTTVDLTLDIDIARPKATAESLASVPDSQWPGASTSSASVIANGKSTDGEGLTRKHALSSLSHFGSGETNEFATFVQGRESLSTDASLKEEIEDDLRTFAEKSDRSEGFAISTALSDGFSGFSTALLEMLQDEFPKYPKFTTGLLSDAASWTRPDTERSKAQRLVNSALACTHLDELSSILLPLQPATPWSPDSAWATFLRDDVDKRSAYSQVLTMHQQSANSELREIDGLSMVSEQLNWRGNNKIASLLGATPMLPPDALQGTEGQRKLRQSLKDFSRHGIAVQDEDEEDYAMYSVVRGYDAEDVAKLQPVLESSTRLREPLSRWICLPEPYPIMPGSSPIFRSLLPDGRPLVLEAPAHADPFSREALFGIAPRPLLSNKDYVVQPATIPIMTRLSTGPRARHWLTYLADEMKEMLRVRSRYLVEYETGDYGLGREGMIECRERLVTLADNYGASPDNDDADVDEHISEDEDFVIE